MWLTGPVAPWHVGSSQTRARTRVSCISRQTLNHCATREALIFLKERKIYETCYKFQELTLTVCFLWTWYNKERKNLRLKKVTLLMSQCILELLEQGDRYFQPNSNQCLCKHTTPSPMVTFHFLLFSYQNIIMDKSRNCGLRLLDLNPTATTYLLRDLGQVKLSLPIYKIGIINLSVSGKLNKIFQEYK